MPISKTHKAYLLQVASSLFVVLNQLNIKVLAKDFSPSMILSVRAGLLILLNFIFLFRQGKSLVVTNAAQLNTLMKRSIASTVSIMLLFISAAYIPIGVANTLFNIQPIVTFFLEKFYLQKIQLNKRHFVLTLMSFAGVTMILQPEFIFGQNTIPVEQYPFYLLAFFSAVTASFSAILLHKLKDTTDKNVALQYNYFFQSGVGYFIYMTTTAGPPPEMYSSADILKTILSIIFIAFIAFLTQITRITAIFLEKPSNIMPFGYAGIIGSLLVDLYIFDTNLNSLAIIGILMTSVGLLGKFVM